ncbi:MAG: hypothetical protein N4A71_22320 [Carboxylicivirga sp.]|nr:hypothetical protein [Carboxylicivirga sp.]
MSYEESFSIWKQQLEAFPIDKLKKVNIPIHIFCAEAEALATAAKKDKTMLIKAGLDWHYVDDLKTLSGTLRYCEANWKNAGQSSIEILWKQKKQEAQDLKKELLRHFNYALHHLPAPKKQLSAISKNRTIEKLIIDLKTLAKMGEEYATTLSGINFDVRLNTQANELSDELADLLARKNTQQKSSQLQKQLRDAAFSLLMDRVSIIRTCGQYVFHNNKSRRIIYISMNSRNHYMKSKTNQ